MFTTKTLTWKTAILIHDSSVEPEIINSVIDILREETPVSIFNYEVICELFSNLLVMGGWVDQEVCQI